MSENRRKIERKSTKYRRNFDLGRFGRWGPAPGRSKTRLERPWNAKLGRFGRQIGRLGCQVGSLGRQVGRLERQVGSPGLLPGPFRERCQRKPFSEQRSKRVFA